MLNHVVSSLGHSFGRFVENHAAAIAIIILVAWVAIKFGNRLIEHFIRRVVRSTHFNDLTPDDATKRQNTLISMFDTLWTVIVWIIAALTILQELSIPIAALLGGASIVGIAVGFGAQSIIKDLLSGVFIIMENQYRVGDVVDLQGAAGKVERITIRSTIVRDEDGNVHYLPNGTILHVINKTMGFSRVNLTIKVAADTNIDKLAEVINEVGKKLSKSEKWADKVLEPPQFINIGSFTEANMEATISGKTQPSEQWAVTGELRRRLLKAFKTNDIKLA